MEHRLTRLCKGCLRYLPDSLFQMRDNGRYYRKSCRSCESKARLRRAFGPLSDATKEKRRKRQLQLDKERRRNPLFRAHYINKDAKNSDRKTEREYNLTIDFTEGKIREGCLYCGQKDPLLLTLDRLDNSIGHLQENVVCSCLRCNLIRGDMPYDAWIMIVPSLRSTIESGVLDGWQPKTRKRQKSTH